MKHVAVLLAVLGGFVVPVASAATFVVSWTNPTTNTDGSTIPATGDGSLSSARVEYGTCNGAAFGVKAGEVVRPMPATNATLNLPVGTHCVRVMVSNTYGAESGPSNVATRVIPPPVPRPPTNLVVDTPVAYDVVPDYRRFAFVRGRAVGTAKIGAACDEDRTVGADLYALVQPGRVVLNRTPRSTALVAHCAPLKPEG